jgi:hypothetical protein
MVMNKMRPEHTVPKENVDGLTSGTSQLTAGHPCRICHRL